MEIMASEVSAAVGGRLEGPDVLVQGVATDSRGSVEGKLFVPLRAARDGHDFVPAALASGAAAYLTERPPVGGTAIVVASTADAFSALAARYRRRLDADVVGITGSVGKTTTKDLVAAILGRDRRAYASPKSFNNSIGVPFTILNAPGDVQALVLEIGANAPGEIEQLCAIAQPTLAVVTRVAPAHTLGFGGIEGVARAKAELVVALHDSGTAVLNADDHRVAAMAALTGARVITFGRTAQADVCLRTISLAPDLRARVAVSTPWGPVEALLAVRGEHQAYNAAAAIAAGGALGASTEAMAQALATAPVSGMRMEMRTAPSGLRVLDDSYNASPVAVEAALEALAAVPARRRVAVLGVMAELGELSVPEHRRLGALASRLGLEVVAVAAPEYGTDTVGDIHEALERLAGLGPDDVVLVKGSREAGLERLAAALAPPLPAPLLGSGHNGVKKEDHC